MTPSTALPVPPLVRECLALSYTEAVDRVLQVLGPEAVCYREGAWKRTIQLIGIPWVLKWPHWGSCAVDAFWTERQVYASLSPRLLRRTAGHWWSHRCCLAEYVEPLLFVPPKLQARFSLIREAFVDAGLGDLRSDNFGLDARGRIRLLDLGGHLLAGKEF